MKNVPDEGGIVNVRDQREERQPPGMTLKPEHVQPVSFVTTK